MTPGVRCSETPTSLADTEVPMPDSTKPRKFRAPIEIREVLDCWERSGEPSADLAEECPRVLRARCDQNVI